ncbi:MAG: hypothetical protein H6551_07745 [Chitinophagales bacterium]|nr:hypothetical protein [Chitinophagaceae bacterium]MCB9065018.1 hypothetical protein [Chitinophagales bacterium]
MKKYTLLYLIAIFGLYLPASAQIDAIVHKAYADDYYINYPISGEEEYEIGDTAAAIYYARYGFDSIYVVKGTVEEYKKVDMSKVGIRVNVFSVTLYWRDSAIHLDQYTTWGGCILKPGIELWQDARYWKNISGRYKINSWTDNYKIGDTVHHKYNKQTSVFNKLINKWTEFRIIAVVKDMDIEKQELVLNITSIEPVRHRKRNKSKYAVFEYDGKQLQAGDMLFTTPQWWYKKGQYGYISRKEIPSFVDGKLYCAIRIPWFDCKGDNYNMSLNNE